LLLPVKLADFGFAKTVEKKNGCRTLCGTPGYLAPEILERWPSYDVKCDIWSVGVILFLLLGGYLPFDDEDEDKVFDRTRNGQYDFRPQFWRNISSGAKDLVTQCLTINPSKRVDATSALNHEWMAVRGSELESRQLDVDKLKSLMDAKRKMRAVVTTVSERVCGAAVPYTISTHCPAWGGHENKHTRSILQRYVYPQNYIPFLILCN
jgi:calcium/calmodulin-dependent protein kinase I